MLAAAALTRRWWMTVLAAAAQRGDGASRRLVRKKMLAAMEEGGIATLGSVIFLSVVSRRQGWRRRLRDLVSRMEKMKMMVVVARSVVSRRGHGSGCPVTERRGGKVVAARVLLEKVEDDAHGLGLSGGGGRGKHGGDARGGGEDGCGAIIGGEDGGDGTSEAKDDDGGGGSRNRGKDDDGGGDEDEYDKFFIIFLRFFTFDTSISPF
ncbi:hypothetical protein LR48_Vigan04g095700 [Vigna angularis]|uniref:Uncharacterized protein n=1 Tax=Phaseolus angularis TaxID=3914 RepID=A0A0L9UDZ3_PHAAN|nr:hypothetical protein LR48_Vigan04g095700 [Vigna angularis]